MAITASGLYVTNFIDSFDTTQLAINLDLETHKVALFLDALAPNFSTDVTYSATNEVPNGGGYTTGGQVLTGTVFTEAVTGSAVFDATDAAWASSTIANAMAAVIYADALADQLIVLSDFVTAVSTTSGTLTVQWAAPGSGGIFNFDLTP